MVHVLSGPDHLAAIAPLTLSKWSRSVAIGFRWGLGHSSGVLFVGLLALLFRELIPVDAISSWGERCVGGMLVMIGIWGLRKSLKAHVHAHEHSHGGNTHVHYHLHAHGHEPAEEPVQEKTHQHTHTAFAIGTIHGVAGSSHFLVVLPAMAFQSRVESIAFLVAFGIGTVLAMILFSAAFGWLGRSLKDHLRFYKLTNAVISSLAIVLGFYWIAAA
jgi:ABC-type nickel/cobalt efflux system permease component RcnA